ncbi:hypothetical protein [Bacillus solimangrovi]|uniref:DUF3794 domain-containing protein n=1 Tax=Bacillus solimangrovi TaxID=1305675 RepID=A0A1E5LEP3_9BACI|nr:hypothetical protein [Bacillus solimangrovi]OEH92512.1 hypothetical protein BFG57_15350 [Bacillus solimangrovi]
MSRSLNYSDLQRECIDAHKIFDYVLTSKEQCFEDVVFTGISSAAGDTISVSSCQIGPDSTCPEISDPENRPTVTVELPDGTDVDLQVVTLQKTIQIIIEGDVTSGGTATPFTSTAVVVFCPEEVLMCAPIGTMVDCMITDTSRCVVGALTLDPANSTATGNVHVLACQGIQTYAEVKLEILAKICDPRGIIPFPECEVNPFPQQCPSIFPPAH